MEQQQPAIRVKVWDGWVRAFHWSIVVLVGISWWSGTEQNWDVHFLSGFAILALVLFRLAWGLVGSETARFSKFLRSPLAALRHLIRFPRPEPDTEIGHNAAGGWMVLLLISLLLVQAVTGLFADDEIFTQGPLARAVDPETSHLATWLHLRVINVILLAIALHVCAIGAYGMLKGHDLVRPMITGHKTLPPGSRAPRLGHPMLAAALLAVAAVIVWGVSRAG